MALSMNLPDEEAARVRGVLDTAPAPSSQRTFSKPAIVTAVVFLAVLSGLGGIVYAFLGEVNSTFSLFAACLSLFAWSAMIEYLAKIAYHAERAADALTKEPPK